MTITGIAGLCGHVNPAGDTLPLLRWFDPLDSPAGPAVEGQAICAGDQAGAAHAALMARQSAVRTQEPDLALPWRSVLEMVLWWRARAGGKCSATRPMA